MVEEGKTAPAFELATSSGKTVTLSSLKGAPTVLYFYPKDDTSGCTAEAKDFTCLAGAFAKAGTRVIGISPDSLESHQAFTKKYDLGIELAADESKAAAEAFGVWVEKSMYGRKYMGVERATFLLDAKGKVRRIWRKVKVPGHADEVLEAVQSLGR